MSDAAREALREEVLALIDRLADGGRDDAARDDLLERIARWQADHVEVVARLRRRGATAPAVPTDVFRHGRVAAHPPDRDARVFLTSGTTSGARGRHCLRDLSLYDRAARAAARHALFPDLERLRLVVLAPHPAEAPESSLSYMLGRFEDWFGIDARWAWRDGALDLDPLVAGLRDAEAAGVPVALLGTSFAFVHAEDALGDARFALPDGSRLMQTGGYKGRSREVAPEALRELLAARYGLPEARIVAEYGMTELSSQLYENTLRAAVGGRPAPPRRLWVPGWVRATVVDPETLAPRPEGEPGVLRIDDPANLDTACAIQTSDLAIARGDELELLGRAPGATPRGCSLAVEEALGPGGEP
jgi:acyl-CoA synthetase (AMP-forming)/AMP-acid ligase II